MPLKKNAWSSWNSITKNNKTCITYWLNKLQNLKTNKNYFLTLNPSELIDENKIIKKVNFTHPYFNNENVKLQKNLHLLQGKKRTWFCGSYFGYGFHEDGLKSSIELIKKFNG
jgi:predicted NAD/FAD-binding protein